MPTHKRISSHNDVPTRTNTASLFNGPTPPLTPAIQNAVNEQFFTPGATDAAKRLFAKPGDPRSLLRSDTHAEWGSQGVFNQPRSRAGPLPSASIQDFAKVYDELKEHEERQKRKQGRRVTRSSPHYNYSSRSGSSDRGFEGKTWTVEPAIHGNGGLVNALRRVSGINEDDQPVDTTWIGTLGMPTDALPDSVKEDIHDTLLNDYQSEVVYCSDKDIDGHYAHYCKTMLWPIFHYQVPDHPKSKAYADHSWEFYRNVNRAFADKVIASYKRGDTIWSEFQMIILSAINANFSQSMTTTSFWYQQWFARS